MTRLEEDLSACKTSRGQRPGCSISDAAVRIARVHDQSAITKSYDSAFQTRKTISLICRGIAAVILLQTLFFKFTAAPESVYIFTKIGLEPWGRIGSGWSN